MPDLAGAYEQTRTTMMDIVRALPEPGLKATVPACPDWDVKDLIGHVTSIARRLAEGTVPRDLNLAMTWDTQTAETRERMVDEEIARQRAASLEGILEEWGAHGPAVEAMIRGERSFPDGSPPFPEWVVLTDLAVHHHDLRGAVGLPGDRDSLATGLSLRSYVEGMRLRSAAEGRPAFGIVAGSRAWVVGDGEPVATVTADPFELARAASGRRSVEQIRAYAWEGDPAPVIDLFYPYGPREDALAE